MSDFTASIVAGLGVLVLIVLLALLFALPVMWMWNYLMPALFDVPTITFLQALAMSALAGFLFKSPQASSK